MILSARGELFVLEPDKNLTRNLTQTPGINERNPVWSADGRHIAYISDASGEDQIVIRKEGWGPEPWTITPPVASRLKNLKWSPDGKKIGFADKQAAYYVVDLDTRVITKVFSDAYAGSVPFCHRILVSGQ